MKSHITVIVDGTAENLEEQFKLAVEQHRLDEDSLESIRSHHWDYWYLFHECGLKDPEIKENYPSLDEELLYNTSYIKNLPQEYQTSGVICLNGKWVDLQDFGWRMIDEPSASNSLAVEKWNRELEGILKSNANNICVEILVHC